MLLLFPYTAPAAIGPVIIAGVDRLIDPGWEVTRAANNRAVLRASLLSEDGAYRPALDEEVVVKYAVPSSSGGMGPFLLFSGGGVDYDYEFAGFINGLEEAGLKDNVEYPIRTQINATDYHQLAERRIINTPIPTGTLKSMLQVIVDYLPGVTLDPAQADGPVLEDQDFNDVKTRDVLDALTTQAGGYVWEITENKILRAFLPGTFPAPFDIDTTTQHLITGVRVTPTREGYANRVIVRTEHNRRAIAEHASALTNPWEMLVKAPESTPDPTLQAIADSILAISLAGQKRVQYTTLERGLRPGQTQIINLASRNINNTFLIQEVRTRHRSGDVTTPFIERTVTAVEGLSVRAGYRDTYKKWNGGSGQSVAGGFAGATVGGAKSIYFLGGSGVEAVSSPTPTWVPVQGGPLSGQGSAQVQIDTVSRGSVAAVITVRLRAMTAGITVKARLFDVTDNVACPGESTIVTGTAWATRVFSTTLTAGSHFYELQLLPGSANEPVYGWGYLE